MPTPEEIKAKADADAKAKADADAKAEKKAAKRPPFSIAPGKALTTKRGILSEGQEIKAADLADGRKAIDHFIGTGHILKG